jgi:serine/threonine protein kinase
MAVVHLAVDEKLGRDVAIKILKERFETHDEIRSRFQHEARVVSAFDHQNILKIYDFSGEDSRQLWIVTELIHGRNVAQILETTPSGWLHPVIAASITREICAALATAHEQGIVHRDVKPENVMITHQGRVKLMDFGIAKIQRVSSMTQTGMFMGSPSYMSPEQIRGRDIDHRSDIYSIGVMLYEVLTGRLPFTGASTTDIAMRILSGEFTHPRYIMSGLPEELDQCVVKCMQLNPDDRPQSIDQVGILFDRFLESLSLDRSAQELERCFKDPLAYGERLSKLLRVTNVKMASTVIVDELLPPRPPIHASHQRQKPEAITKHLPERRHKQRPTKVVSQQAPSAPRMQVTARIQSPTHQRPMYANSRPTSQRDQAPSKNRPPVAPPRHDPVHSPVHSVVHGQNHGQHHGQRPDIRRVSRTVPPTPRRPAHKVRFVIQDSMSPRRESGFSGKFLAAMIVLLSAGIILNTQFHILGSKPKNPASIFGRNTKPSSKPKKKEDSTLTLKPNLAKDGKSAIDEGPKKSSTPSDQSAGIGKSPQSGSPNIADTGRVPPQKIPNKQPYLASAQKNDQKPDQKPDPRNDRNPNQTTSQRPGQKSDSKTISLAQKPFKSGNIGGADPGSASPNLIAGSQPLRPVKPADGSIGIREATAGDEEPSIDVAPIPQPTPLPRKQGPSIATSAKTDALTAKGRVSIASTPAAELYIDGKRYGTTNDLGTTSEWIELIAGDRRIELRRAGFNTRIETVQVVGDTRQKFGPYTLMRSDTPTNKAAVYRLTVSTNTPPVTVTLIQIETRATQTIVMSQTTQTINLERGIYDVTMNHNGDLRKRRIDLSGAAQQLTFSVDFKQPAKTDGATAP